MENIKTFEELLQTIQYKDMTTWGSTQSEPDVPKTSELDKDYLNMIFSDYIEDGCKSSLSKEDDYIKYDILIPFPSSDSYSSTIDSFIKMSDELSNFFLDIKVCVDRVKYEFGDVEVALSKEGGFDQIGGSKLPEFLYIYVINYN